MAIRSTIAALFADSNAQAMSGAIRRMVREAVSEQSGGADQDLADRVAKLEKKLNMTTGAVQAATAQIMALKQELAAAQSAASQAAQKATSASATAESAAEGVTGVEGEIAELKRSLASAPSSTAPAARICQIDGCGGKLRAKGYCAKHYQQMKRGTLSKAR